MNCQCVTKLLSAYFDNELDLESTNAIGEHLRGCDRCACDLKGYQQLRELVDGSQIVAPTPTWEAFESRLNVERLGDARPLHAPLGELPAANAGLLKKRLVWVAVLALAASLLLAFVLRDQAEPDLHLVAQEPSVQSSVAAFNLQPLMELFRQDPNLALQAMSKQFASKEVSIAQAEASFGRPTFVRTSLAKRALPGDAQLVSTRIFQFPFCKCAQGECTCGPDGCNCVACVCERPDGTSYLVIEHCKSQSVTFGDLPVRLVRHGNHQLEQAEVDGRWAVSWEEGGERLSAIGLRNQAEINTLLASN